MSDPRTRPSHDDLGAAAIAALRRRLGETQVQFARRLDADPMTVSKWERGIHPPTGAYAAALRRLLKRHPA